ncbi:MAG: hypothetical protein AAFR99_16650, partial [Cyanobacteria bacterium J06629_9]
MNTAQSTVKPPRAVLEGVYAFPPNRSTLGGTAYFIVENAVQNDRLSGIGIGPSWAVNQQIRRLFRNASAR